MRFGRETKELVRGAMAALPLFAHIYRCAFSLENHVKLFQKICGQFAGFWHNRQCNEFRSKANSVFGVVHASHQHHVEVSTTPLGIQSLLSFCVFPRETHGGTHSETYPGCYTGALWGRFVTYHHGERHNGIKQTQDSQGAY